MNRAGRIGGEGRLLAGGGLLGPMPWIIAVMMLLTILAAAASIGLARMADRLGSGRSLSVEIANADPAARARDAEAVLAILSRTPGISDARRVPDTEIAAALEPWLGDVKDADIPLPAIVEAESGGDLTRLRREIAARVPDAKLTTSADWLAPLANLVSALRLAAAGLLLLMLCAATAVVTLAARAALDLHRPTIDLLHLIGATDGQIARLVERRIARDTLWGGLAGGLGGALLLLFVGQPLAALGSELAGAAARPDPLWPALLFIPPLFALFAMLVARLTIFRALKATL
ncbi:FtsX-like permease family protein [Allosphingosinicella vermicomposti]|uniref:FtsX-like permease family protein n=1 Tax=Allosphingosinicella vermicomposti TaxID=614671 RepID=UPI000D102B5E|nr:FtsX-like permease family protein [Allosphingosinicella vermicomposti]